MRPRRKSRTMKGGGDCMDNFTYPQKIYNNIINEFGDQDTGKILNKLIDMYKESTPEEQKYYTTYDYNPFLKCYIHKHAKTYEKGKADARASGMIRENYKQPYILQQMQERLPRLLSTGKKTPLMYLIDFQANHSRGDKDYRNIMMMRYFLIGRGAKIVESEKNVLPFPCDWYSLTAEEKLKYSDPKLKQEEIGWCENVISEGMNKV